MNSDHVLLTGATGYLGIHVLRSLLERSRASITCVVRGDDDRSANERLASALAWYFPEFDPAVHARRLRVIAGDIAEEMLGLSQSVYDALVAQQGAIVNVAADVRHLGTREHFFRANTQSVASLVELALEGAMKELHHVSSVAVRGRFSTPPRFDAFTEAHLEEGQTFPEHPYAESKYQAERVLRDAFLDGLRGAAYRVGNIGPHSRTSRFQQNIQGSDFASYLRTVTRVGIAPYRPEMRIRLTPVDAMADAIVALATTREATGQTYYVDSPHDVGHYDVMRVLQALGYSIQLIESEQFAERAVELVDDDEALAMLLPAASLEQGIALPIDATWSERVLAEIGFEYPRLTGEWLGGFFDHAIAREFLRPPARHRPGSLVRGLLEP